MDIKGGLTKVDWEITYTLDSYNSQQRYITLRGKVYMGNKAQMWLTGEVKW